MSIDRTIVLNKLNAYFSNQISKQEIYEWVLNIAVAKDFEGAVEKDPLLKTTMNALIEMHHADSSRVPTRKALEYYRRCLSGELEFIPLEAHKELHKLGIPDIPEEEISVDPLFQESLLKKLQEWKYFKDAVLTARLYVIIFAVCSVVVQLISIITPGFMQIGLVVPTRSEAFLDAFPHLAYAYVVLLPSRRLMPTKMFALALPLLVLGVIFYLTISFMILIKLSLNWLFIFAILPFSALPALLALLLVLLQKFGVTDTKK